MPTSLSREERLAAALKRAIAGYRLVSKAFERLSVTEENFELSSEMFAWHRTTRDAAESFQNELEK